MTTNHIPEPGTYYAAGLLWINCPKCAASFKGVGATEDKVTKSAGLEYAIHYETTHTAPAPFAGTVEDPFAGIVDVPTNDGWDT